MSSFVTNIPQTTFTKSNKDLWRHLLLFSPVQNMEDGARSYALQIEILYFRTNTDFLQYLSFMKIYKEDGVDVWDLRQVPKQLPGSEIV